MRSEPNLQIESFTEVTAPGAIQARQVFNTIFPGLKASGIDEFSDTLARKDRLGFLASDPTGSAVGMALLCLRDPSVAQLEYFGVLPNWRRQQLGSTLLHFVETEAAKTGKCYLTLRSVRAALPFYYSSGNDYQFSAAQGPMTKLYKKLAFCESTRANPA